MFTGLIESIGVVRSVKEGGHGWRIVMESAAIARKLKTGDSVSVSGVCLTALDIATKTFAADLAEETVQRTSLSHLTAGSTVNLELPAKAGSPLGGHIVQGHVDGVADLVSLNKVKRGDDWRLVLRLPEELERYAVDKGSIAVEGISLTIARIEGRDLEIAVIPHTYSVTNLKRLHAGALLNIEVDVLAKYAAKQARAGTEAITIDKLLNAGF